jgi:hypothetical protein
MKQDIDFPKVEDVAVAVVKETNELNQDEWFVYLINLQSNNLEGVLVSSTGYGEDQMTGEKIRTSTMRHFFEQIAPKSFRKVEQIIQEVFPLNNEYWVSFYLGKSIYDKKYIFLPETISENNFINIPILNKRGVMIR